MQSSKVGSWLKDRIVSRRWNWDGKQSEKNKKIKITTIQSKLKRHNCTKNKQHDLFMNLFLFYFF